MGTVIEFFRETSFDLETVQILCDAFDKACKSLHDAGQPPIVNEVMAKRIIALAEKGERDPDKLCRVRCGPSANAMTKLGTRHSI
jgi:hypothetical protein